VAGAESTIISIITFMTVIASAISTVNLIGRRNVTGTIVTPVITRAKGTSQAGAARPYLSAANIRQAISSTTAKLHERVQAPEVV
jgi:hypothetical protein